MEGFQLWLNLPAKDKMRNPWYKDFEAAEIPVVKTENGATVRVIAGESQGVAGAVQREVTEPLYIDVELPAGESFNQAIREGHNAFIYAYRGEVIVDGKAVPAQSMAILANNAGADGLQLAAVVLVDGLGRNARDLGNDFLDLGLADGLCRCIAGTGHWHGRPGPGRR